MSETSDHGALLRKALREIQTLRSALAEAKSASREPIAIVGMACRFPGGANNPAEFWELLRNGVDAISEVPRSRWDVDALYDADPDAPGKMYTRFGGFIDSIDRFDAHFFGVSPLDAMNMDPQQRLLLEVAWKAFEDAAIVPDKAPRTGVFVGSFMDDYLQSNFFAADRREIDAYNTLGLLRGLAAGRLAYALNLQGPAMQLDTACSSSLLTAHLAVQALRNRECDLALSGGVNLMLAPEVTIGLCRMRAMTPDGRCKTFDARADGYVRGEGCGIVVLKRLADAMTDGDRIYAVIRGSAVNHDGRSNGLTAPNGSAQKTLIRDALDAAGVAANDVQYVEAHGTGTSLGDPIEAIALGEVLCADRTCTDRTEPLLVGSVKTNFGHLESAAGAAALMKTALALHHGAIPPSLHFRDPNPHIPWDRLPISVASQLTPWPRPEKRFAGISSFGMSGTNVHVVLEQAPPRPVAATDAINVLTLSAATREALDELAANYAVPNDASIRDICDTSNRGRKHFNHRLAIPADSQWGHDALVAAVAAARYRHSTNQPRKRPRVAFLFPGQGTELGETNAGGIQERLFVYQVDLARRWMAFGIRPDVVAGHSVGEYAAACISGAFDFDGGRKLIVERERLMNALPERGTMAAIFADVEKVRAACGDGVSIAALNGSHVVISGPAAGVREVAEKFEGKLLNVANAFHSSLMDPMLDAFESAAAQAPMKRPNIRFVSALTGAEAGGEVVDPAYWRRHVRQPVRFAECIRNVNADVFIEIGPKPTLIGMARHVLDRDDAVMLCGLNAESLATLYECGIDLDWSAQPKANTVSLPTYPFQRQRFWVPKRSVRMRDAAARRIPFSNDVHFELPLHESSDLHDHRLGDSIVVPAGAYLSLALEHLDATTLRDVSFLQPLTIAGDTTLHLVASGDSFRFATEQGGEWVAHCSGKYDRGELRSDAVRPNVAGEPLTASADAGFTLGPSFQWIRSLTRNGDEIFCDFERPSGAETTAFHPGLIDSCLRTRSIGLDDVHVPFHIDELRVFAKPKAPLSCHSTPAVIRLFNALSSGDAAAMEIRGFEVRKLERARELPLLRVEWQPAVAVPAGEHVDVFDFTNVLALRGARNVRFITHGAQAVLAGDRIDPSQAWVWGLVKSAVIEQPQLNWSCVDLDPGVSIDEQLPLLANTPRESLIAFRDGRAYVPRLAQTRMSAPQVRFREDAAYVITGASGALGRQVARWMVEKGARHLILISRTPPLLYGLESASVRVVAADVATAENLLDSPVPVRGIIHAAGIIDDALLDDLTPERFERVFAPKVGGTGNLHRQSLGLDLDFFVCFSSAASLIGSRGQANYAAANAFVDALMHHRRSIGLPGLSINWGAWGGTGMAASHARQMESTGIHLIDPRDGLDTLGRLLQSDAAQIGVIPADWPKLLTSLFGDAAPHFFDKFAQPAAEPQERILPLLEQTPPDARRERLESHIRGLVVSVMGHDAFAAAGDDPSFFELGMDSLMSLDLRNRLQRELDRNLPSTVAFEYPAVRELADYLIAAVLPAGMFA